MATPITNIGMGDIQTEFGGTPETSLSEYYRNLSYVPVTQTKSDHHPVIIPEAPQIVGGGGINPEISIGMFRGLSKKFKHTFNITADRFTTFNLKNELTAVGWSDTTVPVDVTINISAGVYVVSNSVTTPTIDAGDVFPAASLFTLVNNGHIFGKGGKGGRGGVVYPTVPAENGEDGGPAIKLALRTKINNKGVIAGGGGGGGGSSSVMSKVLWPQSGDSGLSDASASSSKAVSGGGGAPFGSHGEVTRPELGVWGDWGTAPFDTTPGFIYQRGEPSVLSTSAGLLTVGSGGIVTQYGGRHSATSGAGGGVGQAGHAGHNPGHLISSSVPFNLFLAAGQGGKAGFAIIGASNVEWSSFGTVKGNLAGIASSVYRNTSNYNILAYLSTTTYSVSEVIRGLQATTRQLNANLTTESNYWAPFTSQWSASWGKYYSYTTTTNMVDFSGNYVGDHFFTDEELPLGLYYEPSSSYYNMNVPSSSGSQIYIIRYQCVCENPNTAPIFVKLFGLFDDSIKYISVNGATKLSFPLGWSQLSDGGSIAGSSSASFEIPSGPCIIEVGILDDNKKTRNVRGNVHMMNLSILSLPYNQVLSTPDRWYVNAVENA